MASIAASLIVLGVSKSGSPALMLIIFLPSAFKSLASCVISIVAEGGIFSILCDSFIGMLQTNSLNSNYS